MKFAILRKPARFIVPRLCAPCFWAGYKDESTGENRANGDRYSPLFSLFTPVK
jgi:hypothetical protein